MNFMAKVVSPIRVIPQIHSNSDGILILRVVNPTFLNPVGSKLQKQALKGSSTTNVAVMDVSWYVMEYALVAQGHCFRASMWARSSMECLSVFEIPWSSVTNKFCKFPKTPRPYPTPGPAATTFDYMMVLVMVHLVNKPVSDVWSTPLGRSAPSCSSTDSLLLPVVSYFYVGIPILPIGHILVLVWIFQPKCVELLNA